MSSRSVAKGALPGTPITYVGMPTPVSAVSAVSVGSRSRHMSVPYVCDVQQLGGAFDGQPGAFSMFGMHCVWSHVAAGLQLGPPSVARMTNVRPGSDLSGERSPRSVAAVGVPPFAGTLVALLNAIDV